MLLHRTQRNEPLLSEPLSASINSFMPVKRVFFEPLLVLDMALIYLMQVLFALYPGTESTMAYHVQNPRVA